MLFTCQPKKKCELWISNGLPPSSARSVPIVSGGPTSTQTFFAKTESVDLKPTRAPTSFVLISCSKSKLNKRAPARELYTGTLLKETGVDLNYLRRDIIPRSRVYTLSCGSVVNGTVANKPLCRRFFPVNAIRANKSIEFFRNPDSQGGAKVR